MKYLIVPNDPLASEEDARKLYETFMEILKQEGDRCMILNNCKVYEIEPTDE